MAYTKHVWKSGEVITAEKLNCIERGVDCLANCSNLWTNQNPEAEFAAQEIALDLADFRVVEVCFVQEVGGKYVNISAEIDKRRAYQHGGAWHGLVKYGNYERTFSVYDDKIGFSDCKHGINYNGKLIPYSIHAFE